MVVASSEVVPKRTWVRVMVSKALAPSMMSLPPPPCTCRSMKPGSKYGRSLSAGSQGAPSMAVTLPWACTRRPRIQPRA
jgi:hypothetical protein